MIGMSWVEAFRRLDALDMDTVVQEPRGRVPRVTTGELQCRLIYGSVTPATVGALLVLAGLPVRADGGDGVAP